MKIFPFASLLLTHPTVGNLDRLGGLAGLGAELLDLLDDIHALGDLSKDNVLPIQPLRLGGAEEELAPVGVGASVGHGKDPGPGVLQGEVLVGELVAVDRLATSSVVVGEVTSLTHESGDDPVEGGSLESESLLSRAERPEVLRSLRDDVRPQSHDDPAQGGAVSGDIEKAVIRHFYFALDLLRNVDKKRV